MAATPIVASAQQDNPNAQPWKPTNEDAQKLVDTIRSDKDKLRACGELGKIQEEMEKAEENNDTKDFDALIAKADGLEQKLGQTTSGVTDGLGKVDPNSAEGQKFTAIFEPRHKQCGVRIRI